MSDVLTLRLGGDTDLGQRLDTLAKTTNRPKSFYVREALRRSLPHLEWENRIVEDVRAIRSGEAKTIPADEVYTGLGIDDETFTPEELAAVLNEIY